MTQSYLRSDLWHSIAWPGHITSRMHFSLLAERAGDPRDHSEPPEHRCRLVIAAVAFGMGKNTQDHASMRYQRPFRITNRLILIRRQVMWSSMLLEYRYTRS